MTCPDCKGTKMLSGFGCPGFVKLELPCRFCGATGAVGLEEMERREKGEQLRADRIARGLSLREEAERLDMGIVEYSDLERGLLQ